MAAFAQSAAHGYQLKKRNMVSVVESFEAWDPLESTAGADPG